MILLFCLLLSVSVSISCGEYTTACKPAGSIYVQYSYTVSVNSNDEAKKIIQTERQYTDSACKKNLYLTFETEYSASVSHKGNESYDDYNLKYKSIQLTVDDEPTFTSLGFKCDQTVKSGSSYNIQKINCDQANLPYTTVYADTLGTTVKDVRIRNGDKVIYMMGLEASYSGLAGCSTEIALITILVIVVVIILIVIVFICCKRKH